MAEKETEEKKVKKPTTQKLTPEEKAIKKEKHKNKVEIDHSIASPIVAEKAVKKELKSRRLAKILGIFVALSLIITAIVYIALLNIEPNNIKIITSSDVTGERLQVSFTGSEWGSTLYCDGPDNMHDLSYNPIYGREHIYTIEEVQKLLCSQNPELGIYSGDSFIAGLYAAKNTSNSAQLVKVSMSLEFNGKNLHQACRVLIGTAVRSDSDIKRDLTLEYDDEGNEIGVNIHDATKAYDVGVEVYAALSTNDKLYGTNINNDKEYGDEYVEYIAYPIASADPNITLAQIDAEADADAQMKGWKATIPFESDKQIFNRYEKLQPGEYLYVFMEVWFEGSDFDCVDSKVGGYVKLEMDNKVVTADSLTNKNISLIKNKIETICTQFGVTKKADVTYDENTLLTDYNINTLSDKKNLVNNILAPAYWTMPGEWQYDGDSMLESATTLRGIAQYLSQYARIRNSYMLGQ